MEFEVSEELANKVYQLVEKVKSSGKLKKGSNEVTKALERGEAKLVIAAGDVEPKDIILHFPVLCKEKEVQFVIVPTKEELGASAGLPVGTAAIAITNLGDAKPAFTTVSKSLSALSKSSGKEKQDKPAEEKPVEKKEEKVDDKPSEEQKETPSEQNSDASKAEENEAN